MSNEPVSQINDLLPCPFCGGPAVAVDIPKFRGIECDSCGADIGANPQAYPSDTRPAEVWLADSAEAWNRRASSPDPLEITEGEAPLMMRLIAQAEALIGFADLSVPEAQIEWTRWRDIKDQALRASIEAINAEYEINFMDSRESK